MAADGLPFDAAGAPVIPDWFPLDGSLRILKAIGHAFGGEALHRIGFSVPAHARFPPEIDGVARALAGLDVAFHMNHRRDGVVMFDPATGTMLEGIGHYGCRSLGGRRLHCESTSVYPCDFDRGVVAGLAARFDPASEVEHAPDGLCRTDGASSCIYRVSW
jgi:hypothetical protein